jgi:hypothetical protein
VKEAGDEDAAAAAAVAVVAVGVLTLPPQELLAAMVLVPLLPLLLQICSSATQGREGQLLSCVPGVLQLSKSPRQDHHSDATKYMHNLIFLSFSKH